MVRLSTRYLVLKLRNPLVAASSPLTGRTDTLERLADAGIGAVVLPSLFEEQIEREELATHDLSLVGHEISPEITGYFDPFTGLEIGATLYMRQLAHAKALLDVPVIASLNGFRPGGWTHHAVLMQDDGADAIELNAYFLATDPETSAADVEDRTVDMVAAVCSAVRVPVAVKIGPWFSSLPHLVGRIGAAGARGVVLFNRFYQPDIDLETLTVEPQLSLSHPSEARLALRWIAILRGRVAIDMAAAGGVDDVDDVIKMLLVGADVVTMASSLLRRGPEHVAMVLTGLEAWMREHDYQSIGELRGALSQRSSPDPAAFERANYVKVLTGYPGSYR